jgi:4'-phosphopantetheinyl transferase
MYSAALGDVRRLSEPAYCRQWLPDTLLAHVPQGRRRDGWLAARVLLAMIVDCGTLPAIHQRAGGKPVFVDAQLPAFSMSHSGDVVVVLLSDSHDVGCDVECIRPRARYTDIAQAYFTPEENHWLQAQNEEARLAHFWRLWTAREAVLKQGGKSVWDMASVNMVPDTLITAGLYIHYQQIDEIAIACCGTQPFDPAWQIDRQTYR